MSKNYHSSGKISWFFIKIHPFIQSHWLALSGFFAKCVTQVAQRIDYAINCSLRTLCRQQLALTLLAIEPLSGFFAKCVTQVAQAKEPLS